MLESSFWVLHKCESIFGRPIRQPSDHINQSYVTVQAVSVPTAGFLPHNSSQLAPHTSLLPFNYPFHTSTTFPLLRPTHLLDCPLDIISYRRQLSHPWECYQWAIRKHNLYFQLHGVTPISHILHVSYPISHKLHVSYPISDELHSQPIGQKLHGVTSHKATNYTCHIPQATNYTCHTP